MNIDLLLREPNYFLKHTHAHFFFAANNQTLMNCISCIDFHEVKQKCQEKKMKNNVSFQN